MSPLEGASPIRLDDNHPGGAHYEEDVSLGDLFSRMTEDVSILVNKEMELAKLEIKEEVSKVGKTAGLFGGTGITALFGALMLSFALAWGLATVMPTWLGFLIVGLIYMAGSAGLFLLGRDELRQVHPVPEQTVATVKEDMRWVKRQMS